MSGRVGDDILTLLWANAESEATTFGYSLASKRGISAIYGERGWRRLATAGDSYRFLMRNGIDMFFDPQE